MSEKRLFPDVFLEHSHALAEARDDREIARALRDGLAAGADHGTVFLYEYQQDGDPAPHLVEVAATWDRTGQEFLPVTGSYLWADFPLHPIAPEVGGGWLALDPEEAPPEVEALVGDTLGLHRAAVVPLMAREHTVGCLLAGWRGEAGPPGDFPPFAEALAAQAASQLILERELEDTRHALENALLTSEEVCVFATLVENAGDAIDIVDLDGVPFYVNPAFMAMYGFASTQEALGADLARLTAPEDRELFEKVSFPQAQAEMWMGNLHRLRQDGTPFAAALTMFGIRDDRDELVGVASIARDVTENLLLEQRLRERAHELEAQRDQLEAAYQEQARLREEVITTQQRLIQELSTPLVPVTDDVLVLPLIGSIDTRRAQRIMEAMLGAIGRQQASVVIVDITGVPVVDTGVANHLLHTAQAARLLGTECILVGITPEVAQTMVQLGVEMKQLTTLSDLQAGIEYALQRTGKRIAAL